MEIRKAFYDLAVPATATGLTETLEELYEYGYRTVAIEEIFNHKRLQKRSSDVFPEPIDLTKLRIRFKNRLQILNRLTIIFTDADVGHDMKISQKLKQYHILAGAPMNETAMQYCCTTFPGDIITMSPDEPKLIMISHKFYQMAERRGIFFELKYAPAIRDSNQRKDMITIGQNYVANRKGGNVVISSGALDRFQVRSPYDIANLGLIFGLSEEQAKSSISHICRKILLKADGRRYGKTVIIGKNIKNAQTDENDTDDDDDDDDEDDDEDLKGFQSDDSMKGNPAKKAKIIEQSS